MVVERDDLLKGLKRIFVGRKWWGKEEPSAYYKPKQPFPVRTVTWYGKKNPEEDFCEAFMYWCMGWDMDEEFEERLLATLRYTE